jgi:type III pantothenate kinase
MVLVDVGNARMKWAQLVGADLHNHGAAMLAKGAADAVATLMAAVEQADRVLIANVAGPRVARLLMDAFAQRGVTVEFARSAEHACGVRCGYQDPARLGVDRWLAVIAAHAAGMGTTCVVDAGTALTVDVVSASGRHYGGLILPGLRMMADSLQQRTSDIGFTTGEAAMPEGLDLFGRNTEEAVTRAALLASAALVDRCAGRIRALQDTLPTVLVTGGDGQALLPWLESPGQFDAHLVLKGLACLARAGRLESD